MIKPTQITRHHVELIENEVSMGCGAWDNIRPEEIIAAVLNTLQICDKCDGKGGFGSGYGDNKVLPSMCGYCDGIGIVENR